MLDVQFVPMREEFVEEIRQIYNYYVVNTTASFHQHEISFEEMHDLLFYANPRFQSFAIFTSDLETLIGYIGLKQYSVREFVRSYRRSIFLSP